MSFKIFSRVYISLPPYYVLEESHRSIFQFTNLLGSRSSMLVSLFIKLYMASLGVIGKVSTYQCSRDRFSPWVRKIPWRRKWQPTPGFLSGKSHGQRSLVGYSPWGRKSVGHDLVTKQQWNLLMSTFFIWQTFNWLFYYYYVCFITIFSCFYIFYWISCFVSPIVLNILWRPFR